ncbi:hypothetical protein LXL04_032470 [Taraxacum kok-saghyz]
MSPTGAQQQRNLGDLLIVDCGTTHTILKSKKYFSKLNPTKGSIQKPQPVQVPYCGACGLPAEYCEFGPDFEKCKPWLIQNAPQLYPDLIKESNSNEADRVSDQLQTSSITDVTGPSGVKLSDASKKLGKKFATGASVVKGPTEKDQVDVQGDISYDIVEFITDTWPDVPESAIYFIEDGKKVPAVENIDHLLEMCTAKLSPAAAPTLTNKLAVQKGINATTLSASKTLAEELTKCSPNVPNSSDLRLENRIFYV